MKCLAITMPEYYYKCEACERITVVDMGMLEEHPETIECGHPDCGDPSLPGVAYRVFTIPGMTILKTEEEGGWMIRAPGQVERNRKEAWKDARESDRLSRQEQRQQDRTPGVDAAQSAADHAEGRSDTSEFREG